MLGTWFEKTVFLTKSRSHLYISSPTPADAHSHSTTRSYSVVMFLLIRKNYLLSDVLTQVFENSRSSHLRLTLAHHIQTMDILSLIVGIVFRSSKSFGIYNFGITDHSLPVSVYAQGSFCYYVLELASQLQISHSTPSSAEISAFFSINSGLLWLCQCSQPTISPCKSSWRQTAGGSQLAAAKKIHVGGYSVRILFNFPIYLGGDVRTIFTNLTAGLQPQCMTSLLIGNALSLTHLSKVLVKVKTLLATRGYGATVARLTPDQTVGRSNRSGLIFAKNRFEQVARTLHANCCPFLTQ